eukprot:3375375-Rhodomonas_salina.1
MVLDVLEHLRESERRYREEGKTRLADCALRNQVSVIFSYVGMRRGVEIWLNCPRTQGLRKDDVTSKQNEHVELFLQSMKND